MRVTMLVMLMLLNVNAFSQVRMVFGSVTDTAGVPIEGATAVLVTAQFATEEKTAATDKKGRFAFRDVKPGDIEITISKSGFLDRIIEFRTDKKRIRDKFEVQMFREGEELVAAEDLVEVSGIIHDTKGNPLPAVQLTATVAGTPFKAEASTDAQGHFSLQSMASNELILLAKLTEYRDQIVKVKVRKNPVAMTGPTDFVMMTLDEAYALMGKVRPKDKMPTPEEEAVEIYNLAVEPYQKGSYEQAEKLAKQALLKDPKQLASLKLLIFANMKTDDWKEVLTYSEQYLKLKPDDVNIMKAANQAAQLTNNTDKADALKAQLKEKGEINKDDLWVDAVNALNGNDDATAHKIIKEILAMDPKDSRAYFELGKIKVREFEFPEAIRYLKTYLKHAPEKDPFRSEAKDLIITLTE